MRLSICVLAFLFHSAVFEDWRPPAKPDPHKILEEAQDDSQAARYADALAKHVWFHENALKYDRALYGVRLSFALSYWVELGKAYPPALQKLTSIRDETAKKVREGGHERDIFEVFGDFAAINRALDEQSKTTDLFVWLDAQKPKAAERVFRVAKDALIRSKEYRLCGKYIDPDRSFAEIVNGYHVNKGIAKSGQHDDAFRDFTEKSFSNSTATLVALLVLNDRKADALKVAEKALKERDDASFREELEQAKKGKVPPPWP